MSRPGSLGQEGQGSRPPSPPSAIGEVLDRQPMGAGGGSTACRGGGVATRGSSSRQGKIDGREVGGGPATASAAGEESQPQPQPQLIREPDNRAEPAAGALEASGSARRRAKQLPPHLLPLHQEAPGIFATRASAQINPRYDTPGNQAAEVCVPFSPSSDALTQSTSDELSPVSAGGSKALPSCSSASQAALDRLKRVEFAAVMSDHDDQKLFASAPPTPQLCGISDKRTAGTRDIEACGGGASDREAGGAATDAAGSAESGNELSRGRNRVRTSASATDAQNTTEGLGARLKQLSNSTRYTKPRMSLLGKPLSLKNARQDARYRRLQARVYNFLERPKTWQSITYHVIVFASVFICLVFSVLSTMSNCVRDTIARPTPQPQPPPPPPGPPPTSTPPPCSKFAFKYSEIASEILFYMETGMLFWFFTEYCLRMWSAGCRSRYQTWKGRLLFARRPFCIVDLIVIIASVIVLALGSDRQMFAASALRGLRFFQILRMIRMDRRGGSWKLLASVVWAHRQELFTTVYIGFLGLIFSSFVMYLIEKDEQDTQISNYADALWWGVITLCTVGYGDVTPKTWSGKIVASFCSIAGISFFALPAGILGSGFALKVQQHQRQKHLIRRRVPAATLIQSLWRCYAADPSSTSVATWKPHMRPMRSPSSAGLDSSNFRRKFGRLSTLKRSKSEKSHAASGNYTPIRRNAMPDLDPSNPQGASDAAIAPGNEASSFEEDAGTDADFEGPSQSQQQQGKTGKKSMIRKFTDLASSLRSHVSLAMMEAPAGTNLEQQPSLTSIAHDDDETPMKLTEVHKNAIRVIRKVKYFVARKKFREALRPYDVKDVIEQYSAGHVDMLARIKVLQSRLDQILGRQGSKDKDAYESKVSLASRIVKVERSVEDIERKLELLIDMYKEDRRVLLDEAPHPPAILDLRESSPRDDDGGAGGAVGGGGSGGGGCSGGGRSVLDSTGSAESDTVVVGGYPRFLPQGLRSRRPVLQLQPQEADSSHRLMRNYSDLGPRSGPKRVTYRYFAQQAGAQAPRQTAAPAEAGEPPSLDFNPFLHTSDSKSSGAAPKTYCEAQIHHGDLAAASSAPSPPPPPVKSLIDFDDEDDDYDDAIVGVGDDGGEGGETPEEGSFFRAPPPPPAPLRSVLKRIHSSPVRRQTSAGGSAGGSAGSGGSHRHSFTNRALDDSDEEGDDAAGQERRGLLSEFSAATVAPAVPTAAVAIPLTQRLPRESAAAAAAQPALIRPDPSGKLKKKSIC